MERNIQISKPYYCDRFTVPQKTPQKVGCLSPALSPLEVRHQRQTITPKSFRHRQREDVRQLKLYLLKAFEQSKMLWEEWMRKKQVWIVGLKAQHRSKMQKILKEIEKLRKKAYQQYRHVCTSKTDNPCQTCQHRSQYIKLLVNKYCRENQPNGKDASQRADQPKSKNIKGKMMNSAQAIKLTQKSDKSGTIGGNHETNLNRKEAKQQNSQNQKENLSNGLVDNAHLLEDSGQGMASFKYYRKNQRQLTQKSKNKLYAFLKDSDNNSGNETNSFRGMRNKNSMFKQSNRMLNTQNSEGDQPLLKSVNSIVEQDPNSLQNSRVSTSRKSVLKYPNASGELQNGNGRSKFMPMPTDDTKEDPNTVRSNRQNNTAFKSGQKSAKSISPFSTKKQLQKQKKKTDSKKKAKSPDDQQVLIDIDQSESIQGDQKWSEGVEIESQGEEYVRPQQKYYKKQQQNSKLSRYRREKLFYTILKRQLADHLSSPEEEQNQQPQETPQARDTQLNSSQHEQTASKYSLMERKQSLISKLNIFKQTTNFQDIKVKITAVLQNKDEFILRKATKQLLVSETLQKSDDAKQKILEMFLADVLKVNDLKRLLRNKFSKQRHWGQKMRQMHQFYTYLEYSLQNFRNNLNNTVENNWRQISLEGNQVEFGIEKLVIEENMGHYEGLQNVQLNEYEHYKEIECSMKYYGIEIKKLQELSQFKHMEPLHLPGLPSTNVAQKSLKNIHEVPEQQLMAGLVSQKSNKVLLT